MLNFRGLKIRNIEFARSRNTACRTLRYAVSTCRTYAVLNFVVSNLHDVELCHVKFVRYKDIACKVCAV